MSDRGRDRAGLRTFVHGSLDQHELERIAERPTIVVDALGTFCPEPVIRTQEAARAMASGETLLLLADDGGVEVDIPAWCMSTGNVYLGLLRETRRYRVLVRIT